MPAVLRHSNQPLLDDTPFQLGPRGPFPRAPLGRVLERRWLHYAFLTKDHGLGMVANVAWLGPEKGMEKDGERCTSILLLYKRGEGWRASQFNAETLVPLWSAFRQPFPFGEFQPFEIGSTNHSNAVRMSMRRTSHPCTSQTVPFAMGQHLRWQSETGVIARGEWNYDGEKISDVEVIGYHERVRGHWGWPELGGWVFGFVNDPTGGPGQPPPTAVVFTLIQPPDPPDAATGSVMLWRNGRLRRHFPRRRIDVAVRGYLERDHVLPVPALSTLFGVPGMEPIPRHLTISAAMGGDRVLLDFRCDAAARVIVPCETGIRPFSVHEVIGRCSVEGIINGEKFAFETYGIVEFAGGAGGD